MPESKESTRGGSKRPNSSSVVASESVMLRVSRTCSSSFYERITVTTPNDVKIPITYQINLCRSVRCWFPFHWRNRRFLNRRSLLRMTPTWAATLEKGKWSEIYCDNGQIGFVDSPSCYWRFASNPHSVHCETWSACPEKLKKNIIQVYRKFMQAAYYYIFCVPSSGE